MKLPYNDYPDELIPRDNYNSHIDLNKLNAQRPFWVCRRIDGKSFDEATDYIEEDKEYELRASVIEGSKEEKTNGFDVQTSMNLLGADFKLAHARLHQDMEISKPWPENKLTDKKYLDGHVEDEEKSFPAIFSSRDLFQKGILVRTDLDTKEKYDQLEKALGNLEDPNLKRLAPKKIQVTARTEITHAPTMSNYWHVMMALYPSLTEDPFKNASSKWKGNLWNLYRKQCFSRVYKPEDVAPFLEEALIEGKWYILE